MRKIYIALLVVLIVLSTVLFYINLKTPIRIALLGNFQEERYAFSTSSIVAGRIAEKDINSGTGIRGRKTELVIKDDDFKNPEETIKFLKKNKIESVITTAASKDLLQIKPYLEENKIVCISVGATSYSLSSQEDYIYRILPDDEKEVRALFDCLTNKNIEKEIVLIYDESNMEYKNSIENAIEKLGGKITFQEGWAGDSLGYKPSNVEAIKDKPILVLSSARNTAFIVQKLKSHGVNNMIFGTSWSGDEYLLSYGGRAVEGFLFVTPADLSNEDDDAMKLSEELKAFKKRNGLIPNSVYKSYKLLKKAYEDKYEKHVTLKEALNSNQFFDMYGDSKEIELIFTVKNGEFTKLKGGSNEGTKN
jgi:ABC-type branched-subunit amino acid transport system substrate-binding protein